MSIEAIVLLIARFGIPLAEQIWTTIQKHGQPTAAMWDDLRVLNQKTAADYFEEAKPTVP